MGRVSHREMTLNDVAPKMDLSPKRVQVTHDLIRSLPAAVRDGRSAGACSALAEERVEQELERPVGLGAVLRSEPVEDHSTFA
jgi:hypothetical protein